MTSVCLAIGIGIAARVSSKINGFIETSRMIGRETLISQMIGRVRCCVLVMAVHKLVESLKCAAERADKMNLISTVREG